MHPLITLFIQLVFGIICALIAHSRGRSPVGWFFIGFLFGCIALVLLLILPNLIEEEEKQQRLVRENRRLREKLRKDRQVADRRHEETSGRLTAHDQALGLDTSQRAEAPPASLPPPPPPPPELTRDDSFQGTMWYYVEDHEKAGPVEFGELKRLYLRRRITPATLVWHESMDDWSAIDRLDDLREALDA